MPKREATPMTVINIKIPHSLYVKFRARCERRGETMAGVLRKYLERITREERRDARNV